MQEQVEKHQIDAGSFPIDAFTFTREDGDLILKDPWNLKIEEGDVILGGTLLGLRFSSKVVSSENYTILDDDGYVTLLVTTGASNRTITLPTASANTGRFLQIVKADSGVGEVIVDGEGAETIEGFTTVRLIRQYDHLQVVCDGTGWVRVGGPIAPVTSEPSLGTPHPFPLDGSNHAQVVYNGTPATTPSYTTIDFSSYVPVGTTMVMCCGSLQGTGADTSLYVGTSTYKTEWAGGRYPIRTYSGSDIIPALVMIPLDSSRYGYISRPNTYFTSALLYGVLWWS